MSWVQRLYETYELAMKLPEQGENPRPIPTSHISQQAYIEIVLDEKGQLLNASVVQGRHPSSRDGGLSHASK